MKPFHPVLWSSFLFACVSEWESEASESDVCEDALPQELIVSGSSLQTHHLNKHDVPEDFSCHSYPTNMLNCSWKFHTLPKGANLSVAVSICVEDTTFFFWSKLFQEKEGSWSRSFDEPKDIVIQFNASLADAWRAYTYMFNEDELEVLSPPSNISISVKDRDLLVTWNQPFSHTTYRPNCFDYELDLGNKEESISLTNKLSYTESNVPTHTYKVRIRAKKSESCSGGPEWSEWSHTVTLEPSAYKLNMLVIVSISLGIPMILLAVLLVVRHQRVSQLLFPPIPRPPPKYIHFLERGDLPNLFYPAPTSTTEEEITEVEDTEES